MTSATCEGSLGGGRGAGQSFFRPENTRGLAGLLGAWNGQDIVFLAGHHERSFGSLGGVKRGHGNTSLQSQGNDRDWFWTEIRSNGRACPPSANYEGPSSQWASLLSAASQAWRIFLTGRFGYHTHCLARNRISRRIKFLFWRRLPKGVDRP